MHKLKKVIKLVAMSWMLTACAVGTSDPNQTSDKEKAKKFTDVAIEYFKTGDNVSARSWLQKAVNYDKNYGRAYSVLATVFQSEKEDLLAEQYFKKSLSVEPKSAMFRNNYGAFLFGQKNYKKACAQLELATQDPFYNLRASALSNLGRCYEALNEEDKARDAYQRSVNIGGGDSFALINIAQSLLSSGEVFKANVKYTQFIQLVTGNQAIHTAESLILGVRLARLNGDSSNVVTYSLLLENLYPNQYKKFKESLQ